MLERSLSTPYPLWTGVTADEEIVRNQLEAAEGMLGRLQRAKAEMEVAGGRC